MSDLKILAGSSDTELRDSVHAYAVACMAIDPLDDDTLTPSLQAGAALNGVILSRVSEADRNRSVSPSPLVTVIRSLTKMIPGHQINARTQAIKIVSRIAIIELASRDKTIAREGGKTAKEGSERINSWIAELTVGGAIESYQKSCFVNSLQQTELDLGGKYPPADLAAAMANLPAFEAMVEALLPQPLEIGASKDSVAP